MKKIVLLLSLFILGVSSCKKDSFDASKQAAADDVAIKAYIAANNIDATKDPSGVYYQVLIPGTGPFPSGSSTVSVNYNGKLLNGTVFAPLSPLTSSLTNLVKGWQIGIPHVNAGGRILLIIPSGLGYGNSPNGSIPANSVLIFTIDLLSFSN